MGDGGPCHPRDNIALSWLAGELGLGADLFTSMMLQRQAYIDWLGDQFVRVAGGRPLVLLGTAYKPGVPLETGSSSLLLANTLTARGRQVKIIRSPADPAGSDLGDQPVAVFIGCPAPEFLELSFPAGSVIVDPWHRVGQAEDVEVLSIGEPW